MRENVDALLTTTFLISIRNFLLLGLKVHALFMSWSFLWKLVRVNKIDFLSEQVLNLFHDRGSGRFFAKKLNTFERMILPSQNLWIPPLCLWRHLWSAPNIWRLQRPKISYHWIFPILSLGENGKKLFYTDGLYV